MIDNRSSFYFFLSVKNEDQSVFFPCKGHVTTGLQGIYQAQRQQLKYNNLPEYFYSYRVNSESQFSCHFHNNLYPESENWL